MKPKRVGPFLLQQVLKRSPDFQARLGHKNTSASSGKPPGVHWTRGRERRKIDCVVDVELGMRLEASAHHGSSARVAGPNSNRQDQGVGLKVSNPHGIKPFIVNSKRREEASNT